MRRFILMLVVLGVVATLPAHAQAGSIDPGMSKAEVIERLGKPVGERQSGQYRYLFYRNGCEVKCGMQDLVILQDDMVVDAIFRSTDFYRRELVANGRDARGRRREARQRRQRDGQDHAGHRCRVYRSIGWRHRYRHTDAGSGRSKAGSDISTANDRRHHARATGCLESDDGRPDHWWTGAVSDRTATEPARHDQRPAEPDDPGPAHPGDEGRAADPVHRVKAESARLRREGAHRPEA
jgi:hypothetical protein